MSIPNNRKIVLVGESIEEAAQSSSGARTIDSYLNVFENFTGSVVFEVQPSMSESGNTEYQEISSMRQPASILIYRGSPSREFSINAKFVSRSEQEGEKNLRYVRLLRSWRMPETEGSTSSGSKPPSRLKLTGLGDWFNSIHVRISSLTIETPEDVDYIRVNGVDVPIVWPVNVSLKETRSPSELENFDIEAFRRGDLFTW